MSSDSLPPPATSLPPIEGECNCGAIQFKAHGPILFNALCHCISCHRARGVSPVHILAVKEVVEEDGDKFFQITQGGDEYLKTYVMPTTPGNSRPMTFSFCTNCGCHIYQRPQGAKFFGMMPINFKTMRGQEGGAEVNPSIDKTSSSDADLHCHKNCLLPKSLWPRAHLNYENRLKDWDDSLPKYKTFSSGDRCENDGTVIKK